MTLDRLKQALERLVQQATRRLDYLAAYPASVLIDHGDMTVDVQPDDTRLPAMTGIPLRVNLPGAVVKVKKGARLLVQFEGGQPSKPIATLYQGGTLERLLISTGLGVVIDVDDDRGPESGDDIYAAPKITITDQAGAYVLWDATPGAEQLYFQDHLGDFVKLDAVTRQLTLSASSDILLNTGAKVKVNGGGIKVARVGDSISTASNTVTGPGSSELEVSS